MWRFHKVVAEFAPVSAMCIPASEDKLYLLAKKRIQRMVEMGTTSFEAKSGYGVIYPIRIENATK